MRYLLNQLILIRFVFLSSSQILLAQLDYLSLFLQQVENYYEIIKEPMDFGTMRAKLHEGMYQNLQQFKVCFALCFMLFCVNNRSQGLNRFMFMLAA